MGTTTNYGWNYGTRKQNPWWNEWVKIFQDIDTEMSLKLNLYGGTTSGTVIGTIYSPAEYDNGVCTTAKTIDPANGNNQKITLTNAQTCVLTFTQPSSGTAKILLKVVQSAAGSFNGAISGGLWPYGVVPTITQTSGAVDIISIYLDGTNAYCVPSQDFR